jgi:hypothetical protein
MASFLLIAPFSIDSTLITCDFNLDMRFVLILNYKHVRTAGLTVRVLCLCVCVCVSQFVSERSAKVDP